MFRRCVLTVVISGSLILGTAIPALAAPSANTKPAKPLVNSAPKSKLGAKTKTLPPAKASKQNKLKTQSSPVKANISPGGVSLTADSAVLIDAATGQVLFEKQADKKRPPASTTKIMTTILALEYGNPDDIVTVSEKAGQTGQASIYLDPGEKISLGNLIEGALIKSGNDACVAISEHVAGSEQMFIKLMNAKAKILGAYNTSFANTNGLPNSNHYSTAYDLALMARYGMKLPRFAEITRTKEAAIEFVKPNSALQVRNTNKLLWMYEFADGVKTGTTNAAGKCLVSSATKNSRQLIAVVLDSPGRFQDSINLLEYGFNNYKPVKLADAGNVLTKFLVYEGEAQEVDAILGGTVEFLALPGDKEKVEQKVVWLKPQIAPVKAGEQLGEVQYWLRGRQVGQAPLYAANAVKQQGLFQRLLGLGK